MKTTGPFEVFEITGTSGSLLLVFYFEKLEPMVSRTLKIYAEA
jgi:hypothetical protein